VPTARSAPRVTWRSQSTGLRRRSATAHRLRLRRTGFAYDARHQQARRGIGGESPRTEIICERRHPRFHVTLPPRPEVARPTMHSSTATAAVRAYGNAESEDPRAHNFRTWQRDRVRRGVAPCTRWRISVGRSPAELDRGISSIERQIAEHEARSPIRPARSLTSTNSTRDSKTRWSRVRGLETFSASVNNPTSLTDSGKAADAAMTNTADHYLRDLGALIQGAGTGCEARQGRRGRRRELRLRTRSACGVARGRVAVAAAGARVRARSGGTVAAGRLTRTGPHLRVGPWAPDDFLTWTAPGSSGASSCSRRWSRSAGLNRAGLHTGWRYHGPRVL
jgi:hypothetical protein